jgi:predicted metal-binding protein
MEGEKESNFGKSESEKTAKFSSEIYPAQISQDFYCLYKIIPSGQVPIDRENSIRLCREGCPSYAKNYSCPPNSPTLEEYIGECRHLLFFIFQAKVPAQAAGLPEGERQKYFNKFDFGANKEVDRIMRELEKRIGARHIAARKCALCKICKKEKEKPCKRPEKMRNCAVSLGIDCKRIAEEHFLYPLDWRDKHKLPGKISYICAIPFHPSGCKERFKGFREIKEIIKTCLGVEDHSLLTAGDMQNNPKNRSLKQNINIFSVQF